MVKVLLQNIFHTHERHIMFQRHMLLSNHISKTEAIGHHTTTAGYVKPTIENRWRRHCLLLQKNVAGDSRNGFFAVSENAILVCNTCCTVHGKELTRLDRIPNSTICILRL